MHRIHLLLKIDIQYASGFFSSFKYITNLITMDTYAMFTLKNHLFNQPKQKHKFGLMDNKIITILCLKSLPRQSKISVFRVTGLKIKLG